MTTELFLKLLTEQGLPVALLIYFIYRLKGIESFIQTTLLAALEKTTAVIERNTAVMKDCQLKKR